MPPRKKAVAAKPPSSKAKAPASKAKKPASKRARTDSDNEQDGEPSTKKAKPNDEEDKPEESDVDDPEPPKKMVTVLKRGAAPVDPCSGMVSSHQVLEMNGEVWDATLNQTDIGKNANKFYVIQLLHPVGDSSNCILFTRWGRLGDNGQQQKKGPFPAATAINEFRKQFQAKAAAPWEARRTMTQKKGKYQWIERVFEDDKEPSASGSGSGSKVEETKEEIPDSTLPPELQTFCQLIFSTTLIASHLSSMNYDANKLPLGKLSKSTILNGFAALKTLAEVIEAPNGDTARSLGGLYEACSELSGRYYSIIPHVFGRARPTVIDNMALLKRELELVDALGEMEIAQKLITSTNYADETGKTINPIDAHFRSLNLLDMTPVAHNSKEFIGLSTYASETHGITHSHFRVQVEHAFRVERLGEEAAWAAGGYDKLADGDRLLLWHGSRTTNFAGILKQGLRIAPPEAPVTGYMFGKGVYFADMMSKSANYCYAHLSNNTGVLLLCEVAVKPHYELTDADYNADQGCKSAKKLSTKGIGRTQPVEWQDAGERLENSALKGVHMPSGPGSATHPAYLQYNEYIVYDAAQIRVRYLLMVKMG